MKRFLFAFLIILCASGCAVPASSTPSTPTPIGTPTPPPTPQPTPPPLSSGLLLGYHSGQYELKRVDLSTGQLLDSVRPLEFGEYPAYSLSPDGSRLALFSYPSAADPEGGALELVDTATLHAITVEGVSLPGMVGTLLYSPDGGRLAAVYPVGALSPDTPPEGWRIALIDLDKKSVVAQADLDFSPNVLRFSSDGATIAMYGVRYGVGPGELPGAPQIALFDTADLHTLWASPVDGLLDGFYPWEGTPLPQDSYAGIQWSPAAIFSPDAAKLYLVHADVDKLTTVDFAQKSIATIDVIPQKSFLDRLMGLGAEVAYAKALKGATLSGVLSADGTRLFVGGTKMDVTTGSANLPESTSTPLAVRVIDVAGGAILSTVDSQAGSIALSEDGRRLFLSHYDYGGAPSTGVVDAVTLKTIAVVDGFQVYPSPMKMADGRIVLPATRWELGGTTTLAVIDADTLKIISSWSDHDSSDWVLPQR